jgi:integrase
MDGAFARTRSTIYLPPHGRQFRNLRWSELDDSLTRIKLPEERTKNGLPRLVPLSAPARDILERRYRIVGRPCVFSRGGGYASWGRYKDALDGRLQESPHSG